MELILASESRYRRELLDRLGVPYEAHAHLCDESASTTADADRRAAELAVAKAESLARRFPRAFLLGSDQVVEVGGAILGKPGGEAAALEQLRSLRGRSHRLITAAALRHPSGQVDTTACVHTLRMRDLGDDELRRYLEADRPFDCCGAYRIERRGIALFESIEGADFTAIVGLPLIAVTSMLRAAGARIP